MINIVYRGKIVCIQQIAIVDNSANSKVMKYFFLVNRKFIILP